MGFYFQVFGSDGMLGRALCRAAHAAGHGVVAVGRHCDITEPWQVSNAHSEAGLAHVRGEVSGECIVVNAAGFTHVDACETDPARAFQVNALGAERLAKISSWHHVHVSTGAVFDGATPGHHDMDGFDEFAPVRPLSAYARSKWAGEELVRRAEPEALIVRVGHLYGPGGKNGFSTMRGRILAGEHVYADGQLVVGPTYVMDAANAIVEAAAKGLSGTLHLAPTGSTTPILFARDMTRRLGHEDLPLFVDDVHRQSENGAPTGHRHYGSAGLGAEGLAYRPKMGLIKSVLARPRGLTPMCTWQEGLRRYLHDMEVP